MFILSAKIVLSCRVARVYFRARNRL